MKQTAFSLLMTAVALSGCASNVVKDDDLVNKTAFALGLARNEFTISNRADSGLQTTYSVNTQSGKRFNCYVEGAFSIGAGNLVSDAICNEIGANAARPACNALLKQAGKC